MFFFLQYKKTVKINFKPISDGAPKIRGFGRRPSTIGLAHTYQTIKELWIADSKIIKSIIKKPDQNYQQKIKIKLIIAINVYAT